jgi:SAM-dependent methyltransferase
MPERTDLFDSTYSHFTDEVLAAVRKETFGEDIGQNSWTTVDEYERFITWLGVARNHHVLEVASGSGGPALFLARAARCRVTGIDSNEAGVATGTDAVNRAGMNEQVRFNLADATARLPFDDDSFDGLICIDSMNHFPDRLAVLREWCRVLRPRHRAVFTDPIVVTGPITNDEVALRSSIGLFVFVPSGLNDALIQQAGFRLVRQEDVSENAVLVAGRWHDARDAHQDDLTRIEGEERFEGLQRFFEAVHRLTRERRLSRIAYVAEKLDLAP